MTLAMNAVSTLRQHNDAILEPLIAAGVTLLPNTSAKTAEEAIFAAHLAREALGTNHKLDWTLTPAGCCPILTLKAAGTSWYNRDYAALHKGRSGIAVKRLEESAVQR